MGELAFQFGQQIDSYFTYSLLHCTGDKAIANT